jgi:hypothetical protein
MHKTYAAVVCPEVLAVEALVGIACSLCTHEGRARALLERLERVSCSVEKPSVFQYFYNRLLLGTAAAMCAVVHIRQSRIQDEA